MHGNTDETFNNEKDSLATLEKHTKKITKFIIDAWAVCDESCLYGS